jgi:hypothetical protein
MRESKWIMLILAGILSCSAALAGDFMEQCRVVDQDGNGLIRQGMADSGYNLQGDADAWIWVPYGECAQINAGDFQDVSEDIRAKIEPSNIDYAQTLEDDDD